MNVFKNSSGDDTLDPRFGAATRNRAASPPKSWLRTWNAVPGDLDLHLSSVKIEMLISWIFWKLVQKCMMSFIVLIFAIELHHSGCFALSLWALLSRSDIFNKSCAKTADVPSRFASSHAAPSWSYSCSILILQANNVESRPYIARWRWGNDYRQ